MRASLQAPRAPAQHTLQPTVHASAESLLGDAIAAPNVLEVIRLLTKRYDEPLFGGTETG